MLTFIKIMSWMIKSWSAVLHNSYIENTQTCRYTPITILHVQIIFKLVILYLWCDPCAWVSSLISALKKLIFSHRSPRITGCPLADHQWSADHRLRNPDIGYQSENYFKINKCINQSWESYSTWYNTSLSITFE